MKQKSLTSGVVASLLCFAANLFAADFAVHEWGTFTAVVGSDGRMLPGLEVEEESVPAFVRSFAGFAPYNKGWDRPVLGVTVKMETPVLYFYSTTARSVRVEVGFNGGSISQWYPDRVAGETMPPPPVRFTDRGQPIDAPPPVDFAAGYRGSAIWNVDVLAPDTAAKINAPQERETPQWPRARVPGANLVRGPRNEVEGFIFYRGIGNFALPLNVTCSADGALTMRNTGVEEMPFVWVYEKPARRGDPVRSWHGKLPGGATHVLPPPTGLAVPAAIPFHGALVQAGLTPEEAKAMIATWRESYFDRPGLRVFWIVPRPFTDAVLPIAIEPRPERLERVLVGRTEVLAPAFEAQVTRDFALDGGKRWMADRYFRAYRERARQLGVTVDVAPVARTP